ncbi:MAG: response regulator transcription factor [Gammaproteobacteria bacterium]|nr:response regulator transcription factor [Gammaproteobacteria bacterium]
MRVLVIEDEQTLCEQIVNDLKEAGYTVDKALDGEEGLYLATELPFDLMVIDLGLPIIPGMEIIQKLRQQENHCPVLILTARDHWEDKVSGLSAGADDYLTKPFHTEELMARVNALIRRSAGHSSPVLRLGPITLDTLQQLILVDEQEIEVTAYEYKLMEYLAHNPSKIVSKTELTEHLYEQDYDRDSNVIEVFVGRLRKKLDPDNSIKPIETLRGRGYRLNSSWQS